jgi:hypothetical protein
MKNKIRIVILGTCIVIGVGALYAHNNGVNAAPMTALAILPTSTPSPLPTSTSTTQVASQGKRQYSKAGFHFSLLYPENLQVQEYPEQGGGFTVTFQDLVADQEVQVYVTPYSGSQISEAQFKLDEPSGVRKNQTDVVVDGARGTMFFSSAPRMNDTREVWFINRGFLYEVTTYKELDSWLAQIMQTWKFI